MVKLSLRITIGLMALTAWGTTTATPRVIHVAPSEYHAANKNWAAAQDDRGFTYFGNDMGLLEFDGLQWTLHTLPKASVVRSVAALSHDTLFTGSFEEFGRWDRDKSGTLRYTSLLPTEARFRPKNSDFWKIYITEKGVLFQSFGELYLYDYKHVRKIDPKMNILFLLRAGDEFWVQKMGGALHRFTNNLFEPIPGSEHFGKSTVRMVVEGPQPGQQIIGTATSGLWLYDGDSFREWNSELSSLMKRYDLNCGISTSRGTYMLGTILNGIYEVDSSGKILQHLSSDNILTNNTIMSLFEDNSNNVWVMSDRGLAYLSYHDGINFLTNQKWPYGSVYDAIVWQNKLFIGTNQGVFYTSLDQLESSDIPTKFHYLTGTQGQVWSFETLDGRLWCCHNTGILEINPNLSVRHTYDMGGYQLKRTTLNGHPTTLYASYYRLRLLDMASGRSTDIEHIPESFCNIEVDHMQNIWLEHPAKGVYKCRMNDDMQGVHNIRYYGGDTGDGLPYKLQVFRVGGRAVLMGENRFFTYNDIQDRIEPDSVLNTCFKGVRGLRRIVSCGGNRFWAIASSGAYQLIYDGYTASLTPCLGIPASNMVYGYENVVALNDSTSIFCCDNGLIIHRSTKGQKRSQLSSPSIESLGAGKNISDRIYFSGDESAMIPYGNNTISFRFAAPNTLAEQLSFRYRLKGVDLLWAENNTTGEAMYARLPKGRYTFEVAAEDRFGNLSEPSRMDIEILSPWYTSIWAYGGYIILVSLMLYGTWMLIMYRYRHIYLRKLRHREIISLRTTNKELSQELEIRDAEIFSQSSMLIAKNELISKIRDMIEDFNRKHDNKMLTPLFYKINSFINNNLDTESDWRLFLIKFEQKHAGFFRILKDRYPDLTSSDLRLCACLKLHLDTKEIAALMNLSVRAVENSRYRLRKKMGLQSSQNLNDFLMEIESAVAMYDNNVTSES